VVFCEIFLSQGIVPASNRLFRHSAEIIHRELKKKCMLKKIIPETWRQGRNVNVKK
jgi:hypothetical protein